jgi:hypothetical protein
MEKMFTMTQAYDIFVSVMSEILFQVCDWLELELVPKVWIGQPVNGEPQQALVRPVQNIHPRSQLQVRPRQ